MTVCARGGFLVLKMADLIDTSSTGNSIITERAENACFFSTTQLRSSFKIDTSSPQIQELKELAATRKPVTNDVVYWAGDACPWRTDNQPIEDADVIEHEKMMMKRAEEDDMAAEFDSIKHRSKGISVSFLFAFTCEFDLWEWITKDVVKYIIKPMTERYGRCRFADLECITPHTGNATVFMSHCWGGRFGDLVAGACGGARTDRYVWIDAFAVRQWPGNQCDLDFRGIIRQCNAVMVAISPQADGTEISEREFTEKEAKDFMSTEQFKAMSAVIPFSRLWCIVELYAGIEYDKAISIKCSTFAPFDRTASDFSVPIGMSQSEAILLVNYSNMVDVANSVSALPRDKERELGIIGGTGVEKVNRRVSEALMTGYTALSLAVSEVDAYMCGEHEALEQIKPDRVQDVLRAACGMGQLEVVNELLSKHQAAPPDVDELSRLLGVSAFTGHSRVVERLLQLEGANINMASGIHKLSSGGHTPLLAAVEGGKLDTVRMLIGCGASLDCVNERGMTPLIRAVEEGYLEVLCTLLDNGADPDQARASDGLTPLVAAIVYNEIDLTRALLSKGADVNKRGFVEAVRLLLANGASDLPNEGMDGITAFSMATQNGHKEVIELLS